MVVAEAEAVHTNLVKAVLVLVVGELTILLVTYSGMRNSKSWVWRRLVITTVAMVAQDQAVL